jgi:aminocarboxymuconate-semialdehyde decarboxylase
VNAPVVDVHAHALPLPLLEDLERGGLADLSDLPRNVLRLAPPLSGLAPGAPIPLPREQYDLAARREAMTAAGVTRQLVSAPPFVFGSLARDDALVLDVTRRSNDALAAHVAGSGEALLGLGTIPVGLPGAAAELTRCLDELGLAGATLGTYGGGRELDDPVNEELWAQLSARRCLTLLHPSRASAPERLADFHLVQLLGYPAETALAAARLVLGGVLDRHDPVLCLVHGGGCLPAALPRLDLGWERKAVTHTSAAPPSHYLRRFLLDTAVFDAVALRRLVSDAGADRVLLGTDFPFDLADRDPVGTVDALGLDPNDRAAVLGGTATRLLGDTVRNPLPTRGIT